MNDSLDTRLRAIVGEQHISEVMRIVYDAMRDVDELNAEQAIRLMTMRKVLRRQDELDEFQHQLELGRHERCWEIVRSLDEYGDRKEDIDRLWVWETRLEQRVREARIKALASPES